MSPLSPPSLARRAFVARAGFTLLEVVLALTISLGMLAVVLFFYQQSSRLRDATLTASAGLSAVRLTMDRLATELRTASPSPGTFSGGPQEIEFVHSGFGDPSTWVENTNAASIGAAFPVERVRYTLLATNDTGGGGGLERTVEPFNQALTQSTNSTANSSTNSANTNLDSGLENAFGSNSPMDSLGGTNAFAAIGLDDTNLSSLWGSTNTTAVASVTTSASLVVPELHYFHLRYWNGTTWLQSWSADTLPRGVEISLGTQPMPTDGSTDTVQTEIFRRVIALPLATPDNSATNSDQTSGVSGTSGSQRGGL